MARTPQRLVVGISGASGSVLGIRLLEALRSTPVETHLVVSPAGLTTIAQETDWGTSAVLGLADVVYQHADIGASIASGSFETMGMVVIPCSIKTLSAIANAYAADLLSRAADVTLKEGRPLLLVVRETPLHRGHLRLMDMAVESGANRPAPQLRVFASRDEDDGDVAELRGALDRLAYPIPVEVGHEEIDENQIGLVATRDIERLHSAGRGRDPPAACQEDRAELAKHRDVINQQDVGARFQASPS